VRFPRRLLLSPRAAADLEEIASDIARDNPARAATFVAELEAKCRAVAASPELYPARADLAAGLWMAVHGRYLVLYRDLPGENSVLVASHDAFGVVGIHVGILEQAHLEFPIEHRRDQFVELFLFEHPLADQFH